MTESIPSLEITALPNGNLRLEDKSYGEGAIVDVHPCQVRLMAERLGVVGRLSASHADVSPPQPTDLERLIPWLAMIETRASQLYENILGVSSLGHEDVNIEIAQAAALADIAEQVLQDAKAIVARGATRRHDVSRIELERNPITPASLEVEGGEEPQRRVASTGPQGELL